MLQTMQEREGRKAREKEGADRAYTKGEGKGDNFGGDEGTTV